MCKTAPARFATRREATSHSSRLTDPGRRRRVTTHRQKNKKVAASSRVPFVSREATLGARRLSGRARRVGFPLPNTWGADRPSDARETTDVDGTFLSRVRAEGATSTSGDRRACRRARAVCLDWTTDGGVEFVEDREPGTGDRGPGTGDRRKRGRGACLGGKTTGTGGSARACAVLSRVERVERVRRGVESSVRRTRGLNGAGVSIHGR